MKQPDTDYDVIVIGGGMVGSMLCAALASEQSELADALNVPVTEPLRVCVLEERLPESFEPHTNPVYDLRVSALSVASENMLRSVGAWEGISSRRCCPFRRLSVWDGEQSGRTDFVAADIHADNLGHIVENRVLQLALLDVLHALPQVSVLSPARLQRYQQTLDGVQVVLEDGQSITAQVLVGADGGNSLVRQLAGISMDKKAYPQHALVATVETSLPQQEITWQRFVTAGPQSFLPLCGSRGSIVWYHNAEEIERLKALDDNAFIECLMATFPEELGTIHALQGRGSFPIAKAHAQSYIANRVALVGDAAHTVHPLAGQGVNLGLLDAAALAQVLRAARASARDIGSHGVLRRYQRWRFGDNQLMIGALDSMYEAFKSRPLLFQQARSASLNLVNNVDIIRNRVMQHAMGVAGFLPDIAKRIPDDV